MSEHDNTEPHHAASPTDHVLTELQLYGWRPFTDEPDPRPLPEGDHVAGAVADIFDALIATFADTRLEPDLDDLLWTIAVARLVLGPDMNIQAPPNLSPGVYQKLVDAGLNDWGGISPVTPDHVNPEAPWPAIAELARKSAEAGKLLVFDDTVEHEAWNSGSEDRIVLIFDIWRPELSEAERREVSALLTFIRPRED